MKDEWKEERKKVKKKNELKENEWREGERGEIEISNSIRKMENRGKKEHSR